MLESWEQPDRAAYTAPSIVVALDEVTLAKIDQEERADGHASAVEGSRARAEAASDLLRPGRTLRSGWRGRSVPRRRATSTRTRRLLMAAQTPLAFEPVHQLRDRMTKGEITPVDIIEGYLNRIARYDAKLHAYIDIYADEARAAAHAAAAAMAAGHRIGPFHGIPVAVEDFVEITGRLTTGGCRAWTTAVRPIPRPWWRRWLRRA